MANRDQLEWTSDACRELGAAVLTEILDIRDPEAVESALERSRARFGGLDGVINSAAVVAPSGKPIQDVEPADWQIFTDVNLTGAWNVCRLSARTMLQRRRGSIVNIASTAGLVGYRGFSGYVTTKHAVIGLTRAAALDLASSGIRVNALCPGSIRDDAEMEGVMMSAIAEALNVAPEEIDETFSRPQPTNRLVEPSAVAAAALFLVSDESSGMTGSVMTVDGGYTAR
jgi:NAD(P)-dependent dehydrogenase (short-subunit alcohol dehydrogenase family)